MDHPLVFAPEASLEDLGLPLWGPDLQVVRLLGSQEFWQHQVLSGLVARAEGNIVLYKGMATSIGQYAPVFLPGEPPSLTEKPTGHSLQGRSQTLPKWPCTCRGQTFFACGSSAPVRVEREGGAAAWLAGTLAAPSVQVTSLCSDTDCLRHRCYGPISLFLSLL